MPVEFLRAPGANRLRWMARLAVLWALAVACKVVYLQVIRFPEYRVKADNQTEKKIRIEPFRGSILDRTGQALAMSLPLDSVSVNPLRLPDQEVAAGVLAPVLELDRDQLLDRIRQAARRRSGFLWVKRKITPEQSERLKSLKLDWIEFARESVRQYPKATLAAHLIGTFGYREGAEEVGTSGIEQALETELRGTPGVQRVLRDSRGRSIESRVVEQAQPGANIALTIDERIQFAADHHLRKAIQEGLGETGSIMVMDPRTGDVLALANYPTFDPNQPPQDGEDPEARSNLAVTAPFEPGSVFKVITVAAALETTSLRPETIINCGGGVIQLFGQTIHDTKAYGALPMADVLARSSNIGAIQVGLRVGERRLHQYIRDFGFGDRTGIELPGESAGVVRKLSGWKKFSVGYIAMGHEISTTTVQLARAMSVIANGGLLVEPRLVHWRQQPGGERERMPVASAARVLKPETAVTMRQMMEGVVLRGTGKRARLAGYSSGGKTGSAQIYDTRHFRYTHKYNATFAGFAPVNNPSVVVVVTLHGASQFGGAVAAPIFRDVASAALRVLSVTRDLPDSAPSPKDEPVDLNDLAIAGAGPAPPLPAAEAVGQDAKGPGYLFGPRVPDFHGKSMRAVLAQTMELGMHLDVEGSGLARTQFPPAGSVLPAGERLRVQFSR